MFKKVLIASLAVVVGLAVIANTRLGSHARLWLRGMKTSMAKQIKPEREIQRLRMEVERLEQQDKVYFDKVATQRVAVRELEAKLTKDQEALAVLKTRLTDLRALVKDAGNSEGQKVSYKGIDFTLAKVKQQIDLDWDRYQPLKGSVESQEAYLATLKKALAQNEEKLFSLEKTRKEMLTQLQNLENELTELRQAKAGQAGVISDQGYDRVQRDINAVKQRLEVEKEKHKLIGARGKGPIEQAEDARAKENKRQQDMDAELGGAPKAVVAPRN
jgi:septal ring factor EnvC (AmiA/AmiB activator)